MKMLHWGLMTHTYRVARLFTEWSECLKGAGQKCIHSKSETTNDKPWQTLNYPVPHTSNIEQPAWLDSTMLEWTKTQMLPKCLKMKQTSKTSSSVLTRWPDAVCMLYGHLRFDVQLVPRNSWWLKRCTFSPEVPHRTDSQASPDGLTLGQTAHRHGMFLHKSTCVPFFHRHRYSNIWETTKRQGWGLNHFLIKYVFPALSLIFSTLATESENRTEHTGNTS